MADPYDLQRFVRAQEHDYEEALSEIRSGRKRSHWMWYIFPQFEGLGVSPTSKQYAVKSVAEARAFLAHPLLGPRLQECAEAAVRIEGLSAADIFGFPDDMKLRSCATLFASVSPAGSVFHRIIDKYFHGEPDADTVRLMHEAHEHP
jgi:uncharacterized protein (DUF1810 family)